jgi:hypothetical protein
MLTEFYDRQMAAKMVTPRLKFGRRYDLNAYRDMWNNSETTRLLERVVQAR